MLTPDEQVAYALEAPPELLPFLPELLADLEELGSDAGQIAGIVAGLGLPAGTRVIDLGCGKGATARAVASATGFHVLGLDLFAPFVTHATSAAAAADLGGLCEFRHADVSTRPRDVAPADVAIYAALGDTLGDHAATVAVIRQYVKPGGFMIVSDVFRREDDDGTFAGFEGYRSQTETLAGLTAHGDRMIEVVVEEVDEAESGEAALIRARALAIATRHPEFRDQLLAFADYQARANQHIADHLVDAIWILQRAPV